MHAGAALVAGIGVACRVVSKAEQEAAGQLRHNLAGPALEVEAVELPRLAAGIDPPVGPPCNGLRVVEKMPHVRQLEARALGHSGILLHCAPGGSRANDRAPAGNVA